MATDESTPDEQQPRARGERDVVIRIPNFGELFGRLLPDDTRRHLRAARREQLLAMRSLIDAALDRLEQADTRAEAKAPRRAEITVE